MCEHLSLSPAPVKPFALAFVESLLLGVMDIVINGRVTRLSFSAAMLVLEATIAEAAASAALRSSMALSAIATMSDSVSCFFSFSAFGFFFTGRASSSSSSVSSSISTTCSLAETFFLT